MCSRVHNGEELVHNLGEFFPCSFIYSRCVVISVTSNRCTCVILFILVTYTAGVSLYIVPAVQMYVLYHFSSGNVHNIYCCAFSNQ